MVELHKSDPRKQSERDSGSAPAKKPASVEEKVCDGGPCPQACEQASDCTPGPCQRFSCIDGVCTQVDDRPTEVNAIMGVVNLDCGGDEYVCGPGIHTSEACCADTCRNGCGGPRCASDGNSTYCCVAVIERGGKNGEPIAPLCSESGKPPCNTEPTEP